MDLTAERMVELLVALAVPGAPWAGQGADRRISPRVGTRYGIRVRLVAATAGAAGGPPRAWLRDLSADGVGVTFLRPVEAGDSFVIELPRRDGQPPRELLCMVVSCERAAEGGAYHVGAKFLASLAEHELQEACDRAVAAKGRRPRPVARAACPASAAPVSRR